MNHLIYTAELPEWAYRLMIRLNLKRIYRKQQQQDPLEVQKKHVESLKKQPIAIATEKANEQHYALPVEFFNLVLGPYKKYSGSYWDEDSNTLESSEKKTLDIYIKRAQIQNGQNILDLGCGWGSFSLYTASLFPQSQITSISNSDQQIKYIQQTAKQRNLTNITAFKNDISTLQFNDNKQFDRIVSIEMLEHLRNYELVFEKIASFLKPNGAFFTQIFTDKQYPSEYTDSFTAKEFFTGGQLPSCNLFSYFDKDLHINEQWELSGTHYQKVSEAWLTQLYKNKKEIKKIFKNANLNSSKEFIKWKLFFILCAEFFGYNNGKKWQINHYLLKHKN